jgi:hypothetical protein
MILFYLFPYFADRVNNPIILTLFYTRGLGIVVLHVMVPQPDGFPPFLLGTFAVLEPGAGEERAVFKLPPGAGAIITNYDPGMAPATDLAPDPAVDPYYSIASKI